MTGCLTGHTTEHLQILWSCCACLARFACADAEVAACWGSMAHGEALAECCELPRPLFALREGTDEEVPRQSRGTQHSLEQDRIFE